MSDETKSPQEASQASKNIIYSFLKKNMNPWDAFLFIGFILPITILFWALCIWGVVEVCHKM
jgi:hypothetical protein